LNAWILIYFRRLFIYIIEVVYTIYLYLFTYES
jgi:hypothetical protein